MEFSSWRQVIQQTNSDQIGQYGIPTIDGFDILYDVAAEPFNPWIQEHISFAGYW